jgi:hypothetical protein
MAALPALPSSSATEVTEKLLLLDSLPYIDTGFDERARMAVCFRVIILHLT